jgi:uncharacterized protein
MGGPIVAEASVIWRRLDQPGHEAARLSFQGSEWRMTGTAVFVSEGRPCRLDYLVVCDADWRTRSGQVNGWLGTDLVAVKVAAEVGRWRLNGVDCPAVAGCVDLDLNFSPSTNMLPIRRLGLAVGAEAPVRAAWLRFPIFTLEPLDQFYRRTGDATYRYESAGGAFVADLRVNAAGFVIEYPGFCQLEAGTEPGRQGGNERESG